jgi:hypothetical protein
MCGKKVDLNKMLNRGESNKTINEMKDTFNNIFKRCEWFQRFQREEITDVDIRTFESLHANALSQSNTETNTESNKPETTESIPTGNKNNKPAENNTTESNKPTGTETTGNNEPAESNENNINNEN